MKIGVIGTGTIASAVVRGTIGEGHEFLVSRRNAQRSADLARELDSVTVADNQAIIDACDVVLLGLTAETAPSVLATLRFRTYQSVISLMAGLALDQVGALVAPARAEAILIPFPAIAHGASPVLVLGNEELVGSIVGKRNQVIELESDESLRAYLCAQAVLSPVAQMIDTAAIWLARRTGNAEQAETFLRSLVVTSLSPTPVRNLLDALNTEGGFNQRLRQQIEAAGLLGHLIEGLDDLEADPKA